VARVKISVPRNLAAIFYFLPRCSLVKSGGMSD
jgi:hypothetical protein